MSERLRFTRQTRLPEIGERGQERLSAAKVALTTAGFAAEIESRYLGGAGVTVTPPSGLLSAGDRATEGSTLPDLGVEDAAARDVASGALAALVTLRAVLEAS